MQFKHKLIYFALGCAFVAIGQVLLNVVIPKVTAQGKKETVEFDKLRVRSLEVVDDEGKVCVLLEKKPRNATVDDVIKAFNDDGVSIYRVGVGTDHGDVAIYGKDGKTGAVMDVDSDGGTVSVRIDGEPRAGILAGPDGGNVAIFGKDGELDALMDVDSDGGSVTIRIDGEPRAGILAGPDGGNVAIYDKDGEPRAAIFADSDGGNVTIYGKDGDPRAVMSEGPGGGMVSVGRDGKPRAAILALRYGGAVTLYGNDKKRRAAMGVNEYGDGFFSTWDKNGYRLRK